MLKRNPSSQMQNPNLYEAAFVTQLHFLQTPVLKSENYPFPHGNEKLVQTKIAMMTKQLTFIDVLIIRQNILKFSFQIHLLAFSKGIFSILVEILGTILHKGKKQFNQEQIRIIGCLRQREKISSRGLIGASKKEDLLFVENYCCLTNNVILQQIQMKKFNLFVLVSQYKYFINKIYQCFKENFQHSQSQRETFFVFDNFFNQPSKQVLRQQKFLNYLSGQKSIIINSDFSVIKMQNISIHANKPKRSVESLIEDSAIDNPDVINFQVLEMKKAYNQTYKSFNIKVQGLESEVAKYKEKCKKLEQANVSLVQKCIEFQKKNDQFNQMKLYCEKMKRKLLYVEGKYEKLFQNRSLVQQTSKQRQSFEKWKITKNSQPQLQKADRNQVYKQISNLISAKVKQFTKEIRLFSMPKQLEIKIQTFLEELIYITPVSGIDGVMMKGLKEKQVGRLITKDQQNFLLSEQKVWKQITGLPSKNENNGFQRTVTPGKKQNLFNQQLIRNTGKRNRSPLSIYNNDDQLGREKKNSSRPKAKIFTDI